MTRTQRALSAGRVAAGVRQSVPAGARGAGARGARRRFVEGEPVWSYRAEHPEPRANVWRIVAKLEPLVEQLRARLRSGVAAREEDLELYEDAALQLLYQRYYPKFYEAGFGSEQANPGRWRFYNEFLADWRHFFAIDGVSFPNEHDPRHTFACFRQIQRAFDITFRDIIGSSLPAARLRGAVWQSIFTHDMRRYRRTLYARMGEFATLITGPSGTGKELAARAIAESRYVPFDDRRLAFADDGEPVFFPINISALSPTLVESELFGHRRGAFTGAVGGPQGLAGDVSRTGVGIPGRAGRYGPGDSGEAAARDRDAHVPSGGRYGGAAVPRQADRGHESRSGAGDAQGAISRGSVLPSVLGPGRRTPSLAEQLAASPGVLRELVFYMARRVAGAEGDALAGEVLPWIEENLGTEYAWPGNYRELEQCVKNVLIRRNYRPARAARGRSGGGVRAARRARGGLTADELLARYVTIVYSRTGSYEETARRLGLDRRTVKAKVDAALLGRLRALVVG